MLPVTLSSPLVSLDQPMAGDAARVFEYCQDPLFERYLTIPWPYTRAHADGFLTEFVPGGWRSDREYTWAMRAPGASELLGVIGLGVSAGSGGSGGAGGPGGRVGSIGFWLGAPHRGRGLVPEAQRLVADWAFSARIVDTIRWECVVGNVASARAARKAGFTFDGEAASVDPYRDGTHPASWRGFLRVADGRRPKAGWPAEVLAP